MELDEARSQLELAEASYQAPTNFYGAPALARIVDGARAAIGSVAKR